MANIIIDLTKKGQTRQYVGPIEGVSFELSSQWKYRIGFSLKQKIFMKKGQPKQEEDNSITGAKEQIQIKFDYDGNGEHFHIVEIGKTQMYQTEIEGVIRISFPNGFPEGLIFEITCLGQGGNL